MCYTCVYIYIYIYVYIYVYVYTCVDVVMNMDGCVCTLLVVPLFLGWLGQQAACWTKSVLVSEVSK